MTSAYQRFIDSMIMDFEKWHDGIGYDLEALDELSAEELERVETLLIARKDEDWRDAEALARIASDRATLALKQSTKGPNREVRLRAGELLHGAGEDPGLEALIVEGLTHGAIGDGLAQAELLAEQHPTEAVKQALLQGARCSTDGRAVRFAALLFYLHGLAPEPFDWNQRPFFLRFAEPDRAGAFAELCRRIGADPASVSCP